jgi:regulator of protease activity HflC (stomatin/prohibitin superfamily)
MSVAKRVIRYIPFTKKKHSWCRTVTLSPGIHWYWPKTTEIEVLPIERQTLDLPVQTLWTSDLQNVSVRAEVVFVIEDIRLAVCKTFDFQQTIQDVAQLAVVEVVASKSSEELALAMRNTHLIDELTDKLRLKLKSYGVGVGRAFLVEFTKSTAIRVYGGQIAATFPLPEQVEQSH